MNKYKIYYIDIQYITYILSNNLLTATKPIDGGNSVVKLCQLLLKIRITGMGCQ